MRKPSWETAGASSFKKPSWELEADNSKIAAEHNTTAYLSGNDFKNQLRPAGESKPKILYTDFNGNPVYDKTPDVLPIKESDSGIAKAGKKVVNTLGRGLNSLAKFNDRAGAKMRQFVFGDNEPYKDPMYTPTTGNKTMDTVADIAGTFESPFIPSGGGTPSMAGPVRNVAEYATTAIAAKAGTKALNSPITQRVVTGAIESVPYSAQQIAVNKDIQSPKEALKTAAGNLALGVGAEVGMMGAGSLIKAIAAKIKAGNALTAVEKETVKNTPELLALPGTKQLMMLPEPKLLVPDVIEALPTRPSKREIDIAKQNFGTETEAKFADTIDKVKQYSEAVRNVKHNVPEQYRKETPFTVAKSTVPPSVEKKFSKETFSSDSATQYAIKKETGQPKFTAYTETGPKQADTRTFTDTNGKTVAQSLQGDEVYDDIVKNLEGTNVISDESVKSVAQNIKDKSGMTLNLKDVYRNFRDAFGRAYPIIKERYLDPFDASKKAYVDTVKQYTDNIYENVVKGLGIKKGSKESAAVQWYGERQRMSGMMDEIDPQTGKKITVPKMVQYTLEDLQKEFPDSWQKIVQADNIFRNAYDELIDAINRTRMQIYPTNPEKLVPKRNDYYRHFRDMQDSVEGFKNMFETPSQIDPKLAGISEYTKPKSRWASFMQKRGMGAYKADAVGGFIDYIQPASYAINIDPHIVKFRGLAKDIADATEKTRNANGFIKWLNDFSNNLAGKTSKYDRLIQEDIPGGRTAMRVLIWLNNRVKANQVLLNARSAVAQLANVPAGIARIHDPVALGKGIGDTLAGVIGKGKSSKLYSQSQFISERYSQNLVSRFDQNIIHQPKRFAAWLLGAFDELGTKYVWNSAYNKAMSEGVKNPVKQADDLTRSVVAGRGIGEVPLMQQSKLFQLVAPFQLEVANLWHIMGDMVKEKDFAGMITLFAGNYLFNTAAEELTGNRVTFDPVDAIIEALTEEDMNAWKMAGRLGGEVLSNIPLGQTAADVYPEYGFNIAGVEMPTRQELFGRNDPTRFGSGLLVVKGMQDPISKVLPPFGGAQIKKSVEGIDALNKGGVFKDDKLRYPVENTTENTIKGALFGKSAFDEAREYYDNNRRDLSEKQTQQVMNSTDQKGVYDAMMRQRTIETLKTKIKALKNGKMSGEEKARQIKALQKQLEAAAQ
jgi:hypothetical protein